VRAGTLNELKARKEKGAIQSISSCVLLDWDDRMRKSHPLTKRNMKSMDQIRKDHAKTQTKGVKFVGSFYEK
jgi:hypothetical protein